VPAVSGDCKGAWPVSAECSPASTTADACKMCGLPFHPHSQSALRRNVLPAIDTCMETKLSAEHE
jgi:hypothetical protein